MLLSWAYLLLSDQSSWSEPQSASPSLAVKNIINLILVMTIWWCLCVESSLVLLEGVFVMTSAFSWENSISLGPASFCIPRPKLPVTPGVSWLPTFAFQSPVMKRTSFLGVHSKGLVGLHGTIQLQLLQRYWLGHRLGSPWYWMVCLWKRTEIILSFLRLHPRPAFRTVLLTMMATPFLLRDSCPQ